jgi:hypothetical protein
MKNRLLVCIAAPPRSGSTLFAQAVQQAGVNLGDEAEFPAPLANLHGSATCEHPLIATCHDRILERFGRFWFHSTPLPVNWWRDPVVRKLRDQLLADLSGSSLARGPAWGWKHPAGALLAPFWADIAAELGCPWRIVVPLRSPLAVARSLTRAGNLPQTQGVRLWILHVLTLLETAPEAIRFFPYDDFLQNPQAGSRSLLDFLGLPADPAVMTAMCEPKFRHCRPCTPEETETGAGAEAAALFRRCLPGGSDTPRMLTSLSEFRRAAEVFDFQHSDVAPTFLESTLAFDAGTGFSVASTLQQLIPHEPDNVFSLEFRLPAQGAQRLVFCPCQGGIWCRCRLERVETDGIFRGIASKNSHGENQGWDVFQSNLTPTYELAGDFSRATRVRISGRIELPSAY